MQTLDAAGINSFSLSCPVKAHQQTNTAVRRDVDELTQLGWQIIDIAPHVIATTSILNSMFGDPESVLSADTLQSYLPPSVEHKSNVRGIISSTPQSQVLWMLVSEVMNHHAPLISRTASFCTDDSCFSIRAGVNASELLHDWRGHCVAINHVISEMGRSESLAGNRAHMLVPALMNELALASEGGWPSVIARGGIRLIRLMQMRQSPRWPVSWDAELQNGRTAVPVLIRDISESGFGFSANSNKLESETVELKFAGGRTLGARLVRLTNGGGGAAFLKPIDQKDPLLRAARLMASAQW